MSKLLLKLISILLLFPLLAEAIEIGPPGKMESLSDLLNTIINISLKVVLPLAVIVVLFAAYTLLTSQGIPEKVSRGRRILTYGFIGLAIVIVAAGSSAIFKNLFGIKEIGFEKTWWESLMEKYKNLPIEGIYPSEKTINNSLTAIDYEIQMWEEKLRSAKELGDSEAAALIEKKIDQLKKDKETLNNLKERASKFQQLTQFTPEDLAILNDSSEGLEYIKKNYPKDDQGWYILPDGGKYNPETKEYISADGKVTQNTRILDDGTILYCH